MICRLIILAFTLNLFAYEASGGTDTIFLRTQPNQVSVMEQTQVLVSQVSGRNKSVPDFERHLVHLTKSSLISKDSTYWMKIIIKNTNDLDSSHLIYYTGEHLYITAYIISEQGDTVTVQRGWMNGEHSNQRFMEYAVPVSLAPLETKTIIACCNNYIRSTTITSKLFSYPAYYKYYDTNEKNLIATRYAYSGTTILLLFLAIIGCVQWYVTRQRVFFYWTMFLFFNMFMVIRIVEITFDLRIVSQVLEGFFFYDVLISSAAEIFYSLFMISFLDLRGKYKYAQTVLRWYNRYLMLTIMVSLYCYYFIGPWSINSVFFLIPYFFSFIFYVSLSVMLMIQTHQKKLSNVVLTGSIIFLTSAVLTCYFTIVHNNNEHAKNRTPYDFYVYGIFFELIFFFSAVMLRQALIEKKAFNVVKDYSKKLEDELALRTEEVKAQTSIIEEQRLQAVKFTYDRQIRELKGHTLKAQMNPHFIFNVLNSINQYIWEHDKLNASSFLTKFSKLVSLVLENNRQSKIPLKRDLEALNLYVELETMRFEGRFEFIQTVCADIDLEHTMIPPLIIQPYVENAIWHGLMHKQSTGTLKMTISRLTTDNLVIIIEDNGIGRMASDRYKLKSTPKAKSYGLQIANERIDLLNKFYNYSSNATIEDLVDENNNPGGTRVTLILSTG